jgi:hypothetical protein
MKFSCVVVLSLAITANSYTPHSYVNHVSRTSSLNQSNRAWGLIGGAQAIAIDDDDTAAGSSSDDASSAESDAEDDDEDEELEEPPTPASPTTTSSPSSSPPSSIETSTPPSPSLLQLLQTKATLLAKSNLAIQSLQQQSSATSDTNTLIKDLKQSGDIILKTATQEFLASTSVSSSQSSTDAQARSRCLTELQDTIKSAVDLVFVKEERKIQDLALRLYYKALYSQGVTSREAFKRAESLYASSLRSAIPSWSPVDSAEGYSTSFTSLLERLDTSNKDLQDLKAKTSQIQTQTLSYLNLQAQQIQQLSTQLYGSPQSSPPLNIALAYRPPGTNFNLQYSLQQGKTAFVVSCVPDEYAPMLGPNGFVNGVGPGNLGVSVNFSM